jgi:aromatic ring-opening dioxygenase LigB subunit
MLHSCILMSPHQTMQEHKIQVQYVFHTEPSNKRPKDPQTQHQLDLQFSRNRLLDQ